MNRVLLLAAVALSLTACDRGGASTGSTPVPARNGPISDDPLISIGSVGGERRGRSLEEWLVDINGDDRFKTFKAINVVGEMGRDAVSAVPAIRKRLYDDSDVGVKKQAVRALGRIGGDEGRDAMVPALSSPDSVLGVIVADAIGNLGSESIPVLVEHLTHENADVRERAGRGLKAVLHTDREQTDADAMAVPVARSLGDPDTRVRDWAVTLLGELGPRAASAAPIVLDKLRSEESLERRRVLYLIVGMFREAGAEAIPDLQAAEDDPDPQVRLFAALSLAHVGAVDEGVGKLVAFLDASQPKDLRLAAADGLRRLGPPAVAALPALKEAKKGADDAMHLMIEQATKSIKGQGVTVLPGPNQQDG